MWQQRGSVWANAAANSGCNACTAHEQHSCQAMVCRCSVISLSQPAASSTHLLINRPQLGGCGARQAVCRCCASQTFFFCCRRGCRSCAASPAGTGLVVCAGGASKCGCIMWPLQPCCFVITEAQVNAHKSSTELPSLIIWRQHPPAGSRFTAAAPRRPRFEGPASPSSSPPVQPLTVCDTMGNHTQSACCTARAVGAHARAGPRWGRRHLASRATDHPNTAHLRALVAAPPSAAPAAAAPLPPPRRRLGRNPPHPRPPALQEEAGARPPRQMQRGGREAGARRPAAAAAGPPRCCLTLASPPAPPGGGLFLLGLLAQRLPQGLCLLLVLLQGAAGC